MLTSAARTVASLMPVPPGSEDALQVCRTRTKKAPTGAAAGAATASVASSGPTATTSAATTTKAKAKARAKPGAATPRPTAAGSGYAKPASTASASRTTSASGAKAGPLAFLDDPKLSMEEKLLKLLGYLNDKWNKELDQKMKEFKTSSSSAGSSGSSSGVGGIMKKVVSFAGSALPGLGISLEALKNPAVRSFAKSVAGPALAAAATAAGQPELAPLALKLGPDLVDFAASAASQSGGGSSPASGAATSGATKDSAEGIGSDKDSQLKLMELQRIIDQQKEMFSLVSNVLRTTHETRMAVIQNVR